MFFVVTQILAMSFTGYVIYEMLRAYIRVPNFIDPNDVEFIMPLATLVFEPVLLVCIPTSKPKFALLWSPGVRGDRCVLLCLNHSLTFFFPLSSRSHSS